MQKIKKIKDKKKVLVIAQENCTVKNKPYYYVRGQDCLNDCSAYNKPRAYKSTHY